MKKLAMVAALGTWALASAALRADVVAEGLARFRPEAARAVVERLKNAPGYDYPRHHAAVEALIAAWTAAGTNAPFAAAPRALYEGYRQAILADPALELDSILCTPEGASDMTLVTEYTSTKKALDDEIARWEEAASLLEELQNE